MEKYKVIIEKGPDGLFHAYNESAEGIGVLIGCGKTPQKAKEDFFCTLKEVADMKTEEGKPRSAFCDMEPEFVYDLASFLSDYDVINTSALARRIGVNESLMRQYKSGGAYLSEKQMERIADGIHELGRELSSLRFR